MDDVVIVITLQKISRALAQDFFDLRFDFGLLKGLPLNLVITLRVHQVFCTQQHQQLAHVHFRDQNLPVASHHVAEISRQRIQVAQVHVADAMTLGALLNSRNKLASQTVME